MKRKEKKNIESGDETPGPSLAGKRGEESKWAGGSIRLEKKGEKREAVGLAGRMGKTKGAKGMAGQRQGEVEGRRRHIA